MQFELMTPDEPSVGNHPVLVLQHGEKRYCQRKPLIGVHAAPYPPELVAFVNRFFHRLADNEQAAWWAIYETVSFLEIERDYIGRPGTISSMDVASEIERLCQDARVTFESMGPVILPYVRSLPMRRGGERDDSVNAFIVILYDVLLSPIVGLRPDTILFDESAHRLELQETPIENHR